MFNKTTRIAICYATILASVAVGLFFAVGREKLLAYATESRPYSMLFSGYSHRDLLEHSGSFKIICLGDSNYFYPPDIRFAADPETFDAHIPGLINEEMKACGFAPEPSFTEWAYAGANMLDYYCLFYKAVKLAPDLIIIPINWRSFSQSWIESPTFFHPELSAFAPLDTDLPLSYEDPIRAAGITAIKQIEYKIHILSLYKIGFENWSSKIRGSALGKNKTDGISNALFGLPARRKKDLKIELLIDDTEEFFQLYYPATVSPENLTFKRMRSLAFIASQHDIKVLFYIWPLDKELLTETKRWQESTFDDSKWIVANAIDAESRKDVFFFDLSDLLAHEDFHDAAGHCTAEGKKKIAEALAPQIALILRGENRFGIAEQG